MSQLWVIYAYLIPLSNKPPSSIVDRFLTPHRVEGSLSPVRRSSPYLSEASLSLEDLGGFLTLRPCMLKAQSEKPVLCRMLPSREHATRTAAFEKGVRRVRVTKIFSGGVLGALVAGVGLVAVGATLASEFLRSLGGFLLLLALLLVPYALYTWEESRAARVGTQPPEDGTRLDPTAAPADVAPAERP